MSKRQLMHLALLFVPPCAIYVVTYLVFRDLYLSIIAAYVVLLMSLQFVDIGEFMLFGVLQELWKEQSETSKQFVFDGVEFQPPSFVKVAPKVILGDANLSNVAKLKYLVGETGMLIPGMRDEFKKLIFLNLFLLIALLIIAPPRTVGSQQISESSDQGRQEATRAAGSNLADGNPANDTPHLSGQNEELIRVQGKLAISYFAVVLQLVWVGRVAFHYRQKNADLYFQTTST
ncbi:MAG: hypothetical protein M3R69_17050 [Acidobacteriota bacterium]|nr:hypothetical protein [Acidobacteriota bacterium]